MPKTSSTVQQISIGSQQELSALLQDSPLELLQKLGRPTWITIPGEDTSRCRAIVTLLHANEPSGLKAIHSLLTNGVQPQTNLGIFIASVEAALYPPAFSHRCLPEESDLNRCFGQSANSNQHKLAADFLEILRDFGPEAVVDTHNTSGHSEVFAVATKNSQAIHQVTQLFTHKLVVIKQSMGTLIEQEIGCPVVTVEFGGFLDPNADLAATQSLEQFLTRGNLFYAEPEFMQELINPLRLEVSRECQLQYASTVEEEAELTMFNTIDQLNFRSLDKGTTIGWIHVDDFNKLIVKDARGNNISNQLFQVNSGQLMTRQNMTIFMATTDPHIAKSDCLLYLCPEGSL